MRELESEVEGFDRKYKAARANVDQLRSELKEKQALIADL